MYDREFRVRGLREQGWGRGLVAAAALIWLWVAYLLVFPFSIDRGEDTEPIECDSRAFHQDTDFKVTYQRDEGERCDAERDLGPVLAALLLSLPWPRSAPACTSPALRRSAPPRTPPRSPV